MKIFLLILISLIVASCVTEDKVGYYLYKNPDKLDKFCPNYDKDTIHTSDTIIKIDTITRIEFDTAFLQPQIDLIRFNDNMTWQAKFDSLAAIKQAQKTVYKNIEKVVFRVDTVYIKETRMLPGKTEQAPTPFRYKILMWVGFILSFLLLILLLRNGRK